jgi:2-polyprenyl-6-methoxyphenol hydroxylase-like FAD-dependent oxidoreductase
MMEVLIRGGGVAAACCAHLLGRAGYRVAMESADRPRLPAILLSDSAQQLICDVFERADLFRGLPPVRTRIVAWGAGAAPVTLPHAAAVISEEDLLARIAPDIASGEVAAPQWTVSTGQPAASRRFGAREAAAIPVDLVPEAEPAACWIESIAGGWLFLITTAPGKGWLLQVGERSPDPLAASRLVAAQIAGRGEPAGTFSTAPRIATPLCGPGWLACGSAAMAFDPLCGDGTAHAVREAILASAVIQAATSGDDAEPLLAHYDARLTAAFQRHLSVCLPYYRTGHATPWWQRETDAVSEGLEWCADALRRFEGFRYRLDGFQLVPLSV